MIKGIVFIVALIGFNTAFAQNWQTNLAQAKETAVKEDRTIVMVFQGSDWCAPCIKLDREIWSTAVFKDYANEHYELVQVDFPRRKKNALSKNQAEQNASLADVYNRNGIFPLVVVMDSNGKVLGESGYKNITPTAYIEELNSFVK